MTRIALLTTGGTIACTTDDSGTLRPTVTGQELLDAVVHLLPHPLTSADITVRELTRLDSSAITLADLDGLIAAVHEALASPDIDGVVITHGTDSMEDTAFALDCFHADERPVVLTGSQRAFDHPGSDGPGNLVDALRLAADPLARRQGALIAFGGWTIPARGALKRHTTDLDGFMSGVPRESRRPAPVPVAPLAGFNVPVLASWAGADRSLVDAALAAGARGLVVEALGAGNIGPDMGAGVADALDSGIPVVITTRVPAGKVTLAYGGGGGGATLGSRGAISAGHLRAGQARMALVAALATGKDVRDLLL
ncbi:asparaginase [Corynebacterium comes]|uniref:asparaginase n=1 Tax=Corynebacterium comes TaxID=2675218 RepID=A0A6B8VXV8_9CORY|nr:asparaginase [Corynebacterium comes]QGU04991.1 L-asparaginase 2 precursor [Corynebacterium comes]